eukprot:TRINITY_DN92149_c0_g1_i1.p1 TRINITY_DN92149_c0_g1~~TRINITY_DN92149_c0_g1_i1.p1  ORF type:complete len:315 (-),score=57.14 TRINITY_DN92149_c0_g1_i1:223-1167(-)
MRNGRNPSARAGPGQAKGYTGKKATSSSTSPGLPPLPRIPQTQESASVPPGLLKAEHKYNLYQQVSFGGSKQFPKRSSSMSALSRFPSPAKQLRLPPLHKGSGGSEPPPALTEYMASSDLGNLCSSSEDDAKEALVVSPAAVVDLARSGEEILRVGPWSVRRLQGESELGLIFLNMEEERVELQPPLQVLEALDIAQDECECEPPMAQESTENVSAETAGEQQELFPLFQRIILGAKTEVPLKMARDILDAIKEDVSIFEQLQKLFSDAPEEPALSLQEGLGEEVEELALSLRPGEVSGVIATEDGIQIIIRLQ